MIRDPGAFIQVAPGREDCATAMEWELQRELQGLTVGASRDDRPGRLRYRTGIDPAELYERGDP